MKKPQTLKIIYCLCFLTASLFAIIHSIITLSEPGSRDGFYIKSAILIADKTVTPTLTPTPNNVIKDGALATEVIGPGTAFWTKVANIQSCEDGDYGYVALAPTEVSNTMQMEDFDFASALSGTENVVGLEFILPQYYDSSGGTATNIDITWWIHVGGLPYGLAITDNLPISGAIASATLGSASSLSGFAITVTEVISPNFGVAFYMTATPEDIVNFEIDCVQIRIYYYS